MSTGAKVLIVLLSIAGLALLLCCGVGLWIWSTGTFEVVETPEAAIETTHGVLVYARYVEAYHDRLWFGGIPGYPDRVYFSEIGNFEAVPATNFVRTRRGNAVTSIRAVGDTLLIFGRNCTDVTQGYTSTDFIVDTVEEAAAAVARIDSLSRARTRAWFERRFTVERMARDYLAIYRDLAGVRMEAAHLRRLNSGDLSLHAVA